jgi:hypothetical protein
MIQLYNRAAFSLLEQHSINCMKYPTIHYKAGFVADDFAQLQANVD